MSKKIRKNKSRSAAAKLGNPGLTMALGMTLGATAGALTKGAKVLEASLDKAEQDESIRQMLQRSGDVAEKAELTGAKAVGGLGMVAGGALGAVYKSGKILLGVKSAKKDESIRKASEIGAHVGMALGSLAVGVPAAYVGLGVGLTAGVLRKGAKVLGAAMAKAAVNDKSIRDAAEIGAKIGSVVDEKLYKTIIAKKEKKANQDKNHDDLETTITSETDSSISSEETPRSPLIKDKFPNKERV